MFNSFEALKKEIIQCTRCPRLVQFREHAPVRKCFAEQTYWRKPVPGFGDPNAYILILGMAPAAQGANRTGRIFTGDESGRFLFQALFKAGLSNQPTSTSMNDGLRLKGCFMTAAVKCVPPQNKPLKEEHENCFPYFENEFLLLKNLKVVLALGKSAFDTYLNMLKKVKAINKLYSFGHGKKIDVPGWPVLYGSYHPSPQNTYTSKLTESMMVDLLQTIKKEQSLD